MKVRELSERLAEMNPAADVLPFCDVNHGQIASGDWEFSLVIDDEDCRRYIRLGRGLAWCRVTVRQRQFGRL